MVYRRGRHFVFALTRNFGRLLRPTAIMDVGSIGQFVRGRRFQVFSRDAYRRDRPLLTAKGLRRYFVFRYYSARCVRPPFAGVRLLQLQASMRPSAVVWATYCGLGDQRIFGMDAVRLQASMTGIFLGFPSALPNSSFSSRRTSVANVQLKVVHAGGARRN